MSKNKLYLYMSLIILIMAYILFSIVDLENPKHLVAAKISCSGFVFGIGVFFLFISNVMKLSIHKKKKVLNILGASLGITFFSTILFSLILIMIWNDKVYEQLIFNNLFLFIPVVAFMMILRLMESE